MNDELNNALVQSAGLGAVEKVKQFLDEGQWNGRGLIDHNQLSLLQLVSISRLNVLQQWKQS